MSPSQIALQLSRDPIMHFFANKNLQERVKNRLPTITFHSDVHSCSWDVKY